MFLLFQDDLAAIFNHWGFVRLLVGMAVPETTDDSNGQQDSRTPCGPTVGECAVVHGPAWTYVFYLIRLFHVNYYCRDTSFDLEQDILFPKYMIVKSPNLRTRRVLSSRRTSTCAFHECLFWVGVSVSLFLFLKKMNKRKCCDVQKLLNTVFKISISPIKISQFKNWPRKKPSLSWRLEWRHSAVATGQVFTSE